MDPFVRSLMEHQRQQLEEEPDASAPMAPGVEVVDILASPPLTQSEEEHVQAAAKAIRFARLRQAGERLKAAGRMPARLSRG